MNNGIISLKHKGVDKYVIPKSLVQQVLKAHHEEAGHPGINKSVKTIARIYTWENMEKDIRDYIRSCHTCQLVKLSPHQPFGQLQPLESPEKPLELIAMDTVVMGSSANNTKAKFIQVVIDHHSRYAWAVAINKNTAASSITVLTNIFKAINADPKRLSPITDPTSQARNSTNFSRLTTLNIHIQAHIGLKQME
jgi:hypothetical protein